MKKVEMLVNVKLPDGSTHYLPIADRDGVLRFSSRKDAYDWVEFILPGRCIPSEVSDNTEVKL